MSKPPEGVYEFGPFRLDPAERLLLREGQPVPLTPKVFDTLLTLVQSHGRLVEKDDLVKRVWPDVIVEEANLARNVWTLRRVLGEGKGEHAYIETVPKVGYRFVSPVTLRLVPTEPGQSPTLAAAAAADHQGPPAAPQPTDRQRRRFRLLFPATLAVVSAVVILWGIVHSPPAARPSPNGLAGLVFLTDGSHDDTAASWIDSSAIFFSRSTAAGRIETWTMTADGGDQRRANVTIPSLVTGRWSPDGQKVVFVKESDLKTVFVADADGAREVTLPFVPGNLDWSPDGSAFVYQLRTSPQTSAIALYVLATGESVNLTKDFAAAADPSFSSDGKRIAFTSWRDGNAEIYVMQADGSDVRRVTAHPAFDNYPVFSPDGTKIAFQSNREDERVEVYLQNLNDQTPPKRLTRSVSLTGIAPKCWSPDGTRLLVYTNRSGRHQIAVLNVDPYSPRLVLRDDDVDLSYPRTSTDGKRLLHEARLADGSVELRLTDLDTKRTERLYKTDRDYPLGFHLEPAWAADNALIAFSARINGNSEIFSVKPDRTGLRNLSQHPARDTSPTFSADGREIAFARDSYGRSLLYRMDTSGNGQRRLTAAPGYELAPALSPDGVHLAFAGDRESRGLDIFLLDLTRPNVEKPLVSRRLHDVLPSFSPDGRRIVFIANGDGNPEIYVMNSDGSGLLRVTHSREEETGPQFSHDGKRILFSSNRDGRFAIYEIALE
jgi:Tol biopolymer transport system component/DNA-binding winged helix-turn-helix (wHTH) protein